MTATEELRRMLDERGVEWFETAPLKTEWNGTGILSDIGFQAIGELPPAPQYLLLDADHLFTPEQAIAATLGLCNCTNDCTNGERTRACLPHFWTHDGTLHIEATRMPTRIVVCEGGTCEFVPKRELDASEAENAKLRELVADMWFWHYEGHIDSESQERQMKHIDGVLNRMRELGVGVSE